MEMPSGERLSPELQRDELIYAEHLARYRLAAKIVPGRRVLDAGCGEGYGTSMVVAAGAASTVGVDIDAPTIERASERYGLDFCVADVVELPFEDDSFDIVLCFETIEHVADAPRAVAEFRRVLAGDGQLVVSTPNSTEYVVANEFHVREFTPAEFDRLLAESFPERTWLYQQNWLVSAILDEDQFRAGEERPLDVELVKTSAGEPGRELYAVVICGPLPSPPGQVAVASGIYEAHRMSENLSAWQERSELAEERSELAEHQRREWEKRATTAERQREGWEERAAEAERQVEETRVRLARVEYDLEGLVSSLSWRVTGPLRWLRERLSPRR